MATRIARPPRGLGVLKWLGPGIMWGLSSAGAGEIFYSSRVGARYGFSLLWLALLAMFFSWIIIREIGRYTIVSNQSIMRGLSQMSGQSNWAVFAYSLPHMVDATFTVLGHAALAGALFFIALHGSLDLYTIILIALATLIVAGGSFRGVNILNAAMAAVLLVTSLFIVSSVFPGLAKFASGLVPSIPSHLDLYFILPWFGFLLIHGAPWYSYWLRKQGFGERQDDASAPADRHDLLLSWSRLSALTALVGSLLAGTFAIIFYTIGTQVLKGANNGASGLDFARLLSQAIQQHLGPIGFWLFIVTTAGTFWSTAFDTQDGAGRLLADSTLIVLKKTNETSGWLTPENLKRLYVFLLMTAVPIIALLVAADPFALLNVAGITSVITTPIIAYATLWLNKKYLPRDLQPNLLSTVLLFLASSFYFIVAGVYLLHLVGINLF